MNDGYLTESDFQKAVDGLRNGERVSFQGEKMISGSLCEYTICNKCLHIYKREEESCGRCGEKRSTPGKIRCLDLPPVE